MAYIWQRDQWPHLRWDHSALAPLVARVSRGQARLLGRMEGLGFELRSEAHLRTLTEDVVKSSDIEGEKLPSDQVRSSIARRLGIDIGGSVPTDRHVDGVVEMMIDATTHFDRPLTRKRLFAWHAALFPAGRNALSRIRVGRWRDDAAGPMQVVSGPIGRQKVHYEAPPAPQVNGEMKALLAWFQRPGDTDLLLVAGLAHLRFVTLHPFDDGNGRIARAIADMALARSEGSGQRFYSMSAQIRTERDDYYAILERTQRAGVDVTAWQIWFLECLERAIDGAQVTLAAVLNKARFWLRFSKVPFNDRQTAVLNGLLDGFEGNLTSSRWAKSARCSQDTAARDIVDLIAKGVLVRNSAGGRSTSYRLADNPGARS